MKGNCRALAFVLISLAFGIASCATTTLNAVWKDETYQSKLGKVVIIGAARSQATRNLFEDQFVRELRDRGVDAIASYQLFPLEQISDRQAVAEKVKGINAHTVLVTRLVDKTTVTSYVPGQVYVVPSYYRSWGSYYGYVYATPARAYEDEVLYVETNLYDVKTEALVWSARSETWVAEGDHQLIRSFIGIMTQQLSRDGLI